MADSRKLVWALTSLNMCLPSYYLHYRLCLYFGGIFDEFASLKVELF